jgi:hypothetical protein
MYVVYRKRIGEVKGWKVGGVCLKWNLRFGQGEVEMLLWRRESEQTATASSSSLQQWRLI